ncbi:MAG: hypothetical protein E6J89_02905 [Deltaproteobacteria bacterium]|nr:MAG: hypothetical protein E6J89_02905 [Deltaproteobacteria bacterium]
MPALKKEFVFDMVLIPEGAFLMGSDDGMDNERPVHRVWVDSFMMGTFPVTNREYEIFVQDGGGRRCRLVRCGSLLQLVKRAYWKTIPSPDRSGMGACGSRRARKSEISLGQ